MTGRRARRGRETGARGQDVVEFALVTPLLLAVLLVLVELAVVVFQYNAVVSVARQGARHGIVAQGTPAQIQAAAVAGAEDMATAANLRSADLRITVPLASIAAGRVQVQVEYDVRLIIAPVIQAIGGGSPGPYTLRATSSMIRE